MTKRMVVAAFVASVCLSCGPVGGDIGNNNNSTTGPCTPGQTRCSTLSIEVCDANGIWILQNTCMSPNPYCTQTSFGPQCTPCQANMNFCQNGDVWSCTPDGQPGGLVEQCTGDTECSGGTCTSPCLVAEAQNSYIGCDYWPTPTANSVADAFLQNFGVVVHNANNKEATVRITLGANLVEERIVAAGQLETFTLGLDTGLKGGDGDQSLKVADAAYHLTSTMPVTVYQFNPLDYQLDADGSLCPSDVNNGTYPPCHSYSNDASLLLPSYVLSNNYIVMARQTFGVDQGGFGYGFIPGFMTIVAIEDNTQVTVTLSANTAGGPDVQAGSPGTVQQYLMNAGEALQILSAAPTSCSGGTVSPTQDDCTGLGMLYPCSYCDMGQAYDLTGTRIASTAPVAVYSGHLCSFVPYDTWACDHLEEQMMPLETWGKNFVVGRTEPQAAAGFSAEPNVIRIVSGANGNNVRFTPAQPQVGDSVTLNEGQWVEFMTTQDFHVEADYAIMVGQFLVGQNYYSDQYDYHGDPAYSLMVPIEQFRTSYTFLAPSTITYNYVNVVKRVNEGGPTVMLDGQPIPDGSFSQPIGGTEYGVARVSITGTHHTIESTEPFGIVVYGFATYTSYSYPGGLDLKYINPVD